MEIPNHVGATQTTEEIQDFQSYRADQTEQEPFLPISKELQAAMENLFKFNPCN